MNITEELKAMNQTQLDNLEGNMKAMIKARTDLNNRMNELIIAAQKMGYSINPKSGKVKGL